MNDTTLISKMDEFYLLTSQLYDSLLKDDITEDDAATLDAQGEND
jgi:hypothetical protein